MIGNVTYDETWVVSSIKKLDDCDNQIFTEVDFLLLPCLPDYIAMYLVFCMLCCILKSDS